MKKLLITSAIFIGLSACNGNSAADSNATGDTTNSAGITNPSAPDTSKLPSGMDNSEVISTDTAAMNTQNAINKAKVAEKKKQ